MFAEHRSSTTFENERRQNKQYFFPSLLFPSVLDFCTTPKCFSSFLSCIESPLCKRHRLVMLSQCEGVLLFAQDFVVVVNRMQGLISINKIAVGERRVGKSDGMQAPVWFMDYPRCSTNAGFSADECQLCKTFIVNILVVRLVNFLCLLLFSQVVLCYLSHVQN